MAEVSCFLCFSDKTQVELDDLPHTLGLWHALYRA